MSSLTDLTPAQKTARDIWTSGNYPEVADRLIRAFGPTLVQELRIGPGQRVLDVACGAGNVAIQAALAGAAVTALDITPALLARGAAEAWAAGVDVSWVDGDAESLPFEDGSFDVVTSAVGVMFCASHERAAAELVRVCRPGGDIGLINWTPDGLIGSMFPVLGPYLPAPPAGAKPGSLWGTEDYVAELLGDGVDELCSERRSVLFDGVAPDAFVNLMRASYGPVLRVFERLRDDRARSDELDGALRRFARQWNTGEPGNPRLESEYQLTLARRRAL
jgi:2-polyprenyl-6-hydroxyphenyl methylase/3-demethylubiquinone-9 3-methyltransferase